MPCDRRYQLTGGGTSALYVASVSVFLVDRSKIRLKSWTEEHLTAGGSSGF